MNYKPESGSLRFLFFMIEELYTTKVTHNSAHTDIGVFHFLIQCRDWVERESQNQNITSLRNN